MTTKTIPDLEGITAFLVGGGWLEVEPGTLSLRESTRDGVFYHFRMTGYLSKDRWVNLGTDSVDAVEYKPLSPQIEVREKVNSLLGVK